MRSYQPLVALLAATVAALASRSASAQVLPDDTTIAPSPPPREAPAPAEEARPLRAGVIGGVGFPHPLAIEGLVKIADHIALGAEYATMPTITVSDVDVHYWAVSGDARVFPFGGALFVGVRAGRQHVSADTSIQPISSTRAALAVDSWTFNPRIGILWTASWGLTLGADAGVQIPFGSQVTNDVPPIVANSDQVRTAANAFGKQVVPSIDLLRVGLLL